MVREFSLLWALASAVHLYRKSTRKQKEFFFFRRLLQVCNAQD